MSTFGKSGGDTQRSRDVEEMMDLAQAKSQLKIHGDALAMLAKFANGLSAENAELREGLAGLKAWLSRTISTKINEALSEWQIKANRLLSDAAGDAESRARQGEKEVKDLEELLTKPGTMRSVRLVHDAQGKTVGAVIHDPT
jgi:hypothetical protein